MHRPWPSPRALRYPPERPTPLFTRTALQLPPPAATPRVWQATATESFHYIDHRRVATVGGLSLVQRTKSPTTPSIPFPSSPSKPTLSRSAYLPSPILPSAATATRSPHLKNGSLKPCVGSNASISRTGVSHSGALPPVTASRASRAPSSAIEASSGIPSLSLLSPLTPTMQQAATARATSSLRMSRQPISSRRSPSYFRLLPSSPPLVRREPSQPDLQTRERVGELGPGVLSHPSSLLPPAHPAPSHRDFPQREFSHRESSQRDFSQRDSSQKVVSLGESSLPSTPRHVTAAFGGRPLSPFRRRRGLRLPAPVSLSPPVSPLCTPALVAASSASSSARLSSSSDDLTSSDDSSSSGGLWNMPAHSKPPVNVPRLALPALQPALLGIQAAPPCGLLSSQSRQTSSGHGRSPGARSMSRGLRSTCLSPITLEEAIKDALSKLSNREPIRRRASISLPFKYKRRKSQAVFESRRQLWEEVQRNLVTRGEGNVTSGRGFSSRTKMSRSPRSPSSAGYQRVLGMFVQVLSRLTRERVVTTEDVAAFLVGYLRRRGVRVLALDFDNTVTKRHSGGCIDGSSRSTSRLWCSLSPDANALGQAAQLQGLTLACVTFSDEKMKTLLTGAKPDAQLLAGQELIETFLEKSGAAFTFDKVYPFYPRLYQNESVFRAVADGVDEWTVMPRSKNFHLARVCRDFDVSPSEVLLIDDDRTNVAEAARSGYLTLHVRKAAGLSFSSMSADRL